MVIIKYNCHNNHFNLQAFVIYEYSKPVSLLGPRAKIEEKHLFHSPRIVLVLQYLRDWPTPLWGKTNENPFYDFLITTI